MKRAMVTLAVVLFAAVLWPGLGTSNVVAVAATPTPAALQYDEIARPIIPPATPPAPGSFQIDYKAIMDAAAANAPAAGAAPSDGSAATPTPAPRRGGLGGILGALAGAPGAGGGPGGAPAGLGGVQAMMQSMRLGHLTRLTYYKGWLRTDDPVAQTATISKCQEHQFISLDLAKKTYTLTNTQPACHTPAMPMGPRGRTQTENLAPGTADTTITASEQGLGPLTIDTIATDGYDNSMAMSTTNATGSCSNSSGQMNMEQYISKIGTPRQFCPLPHTTASEDPTTMIVHGGCKPTMHFSGSAMGMRSANLLVMYSKMTFNGGQAESHMGGFAMVTQRGNVKWFGGAPADALFTIPPGFTQAGQ
jgi:hypothetical protein